MKKAYEAPAMQIVVLNPEETLSTYCMPSEIYSDRTNRLTKRMISMRRVTDATNRSDSYTFYRASSPSGITRP